MALLLAFAWLAALTPALPLALVVDGVVGQWPRGELSLAEPGGVMLAEVLRASARELVIAAKLAPLWLACVAALAIVPQGALAAQLAAPRPLPLFEAVGLAARRGPGLLAVAAAHLLARVLLLGLVAFFAGASTVVAKSRAGELAVVACVASLGVLLAGALRLVSDVAEVRVLTSDGSAGGALLDALGALSWRSVGAVICAGLLGAVTFAVAVGSAHAVGSSTTAQAAVSGLLRAAALASLVVTRALWLSIAAGRARESR